MSTPTIRRARCACIASLFTLVITALPSAAQDRVVVRALGVVSPGVGDVETTVLPGVGVDVTVRDTVQLFGEFAQEVGHSYPLIRVSVSVSGGDGGGRAETTVIRFAFVEHERLRTDGIWTAGVRFIVPPDRPVRAFVELGAGQIRTRIEADVFTDHPETWSFTQRDPYALLGGGFTTALSENTVLTVGYRWCVLSPGTAESGRSLIHAGVGLRF